MENDFLRFSPKRVLYSVVMASTLWVGSPQLVFSEVRDVQAILQSGFVKGQVVDEKGEPIIGASISVKGTTNGVITDMDGNFTLNNISGGVLIISYVGFQTQEVNITGKPLKIVLREDSEMLDEIVVVGYGVQKKATLSGSVTQVKGDEVLAGKSTQSVASALQGTIPGLTITRTSSRPGNEGTSIT